MDAGLVVNLINILIIQAFGKMKWQGWTKFLLYFLTLSCNMWYRDVKFSIKLSENNNLDIDDVKIITRD